MSLESLSSVSVAILSCNRCNDLWQTLRVLYSSGAPWREIVVADNASTDGSVAMVREQFPEVTVIELAENKGVAGLNRALAACSGEWVLSLDDDSAPVLKTWGRLVEGLSRFSEEYDAITFSVRSPGGVHSVGSGPVVSPYLGLHQAGSLVKRSLIERLGGYDESLFLWGVELDLVARALAVGARLGKCDEAVVEHRCTPANRSSSRHAYFYTRNLLVFLRRYAPEARRRELMEAYLSRVFTFTLLHRTTVYLRAALAARRWDVESNSRLDEVAFQEMGADFRLPFSFLG